YPQPFAFKPERWLSHKPGTYEWIPFGGGIRRCLGAALAMAEQRVVLEAMLRRVDLEAEDARPEHDVHRNVTMIPARGARGGVRFAFRHFPLTELHPHALAAAAAAQAADRQRRFWEMHELLFHRQKALTEQDLRHYGAELGLEPQSFDADRRGAGVLERIRRDIESGLASGEVQGTPTLFIDGVVHRGSYDAETLLD